MGLQPDLGILCLFLLFHSLILRQVSSVLPVFFQLQHGNKLYLGMSQGSMRIH